MKQNKAMDAQGSIVRAEPCRLSRQHDRKIVPVNDFFVGTLTQDLLDAITAAAKYLLDLIRIVVN